LPTLLKAWGFFVFTTLPTFVQSQPAAVTLSAARSMRTGPARQDAKLFALADNMDASISPRERRQK